MRTADKGDKVKVHYKGTLKDGSVFDSSTDRDPLEFTLGSGQVIPGFDNAVIGMELNEKKTVEIPVNEAYGERNDQMILQVPKKELPEDLKPEVGMQLQLQQPNGQPAIVVVSEITEDSIVLDGNHPLAGKDLTFELELVEIV